MRDALITRSDEYFSLSRVEALEAEDLEEE
jgi:hypothetical protein